MNCAPTFAGASSRAYRYISGWLMERWAPPPVAKDTNIYTLFISFATGGGAHLSMSQDRKSTRLNSSHGYISYAVFCLKKKNKDTLVVVIHANRTTIATRHGRTPHALTSTHYLCMIQHMLWCMHESPQRHLSPSPLCAP